LASRGVSDKVRRGYHVIARCCAHWACPEHISIFQSLFRDCGWASRIKKKEKNYKKKGQWVVDPLAEILFSHSFEWQTEIIA
jgi:hypothetical protein